MTPTLLGRWQTRLLLFVIVGIPVTWWWTEVLATRDGGRSLVPAGIIVTILLVGLALDWVYVRLHKRHWDHDWPFAYQLASMIFEFIVVLVLIHFGLVPWLPSGILYFPQAVWDATRHFAAVLVPAFLLLLGPLQTFLVRWRFKGGELGRM